MPGHVILLVRAGIYIIENINLEALAADALPLKFQGARGPPWNPSESVP